MVLVYSNVARMCVFSSCVFICSRFKFNLDQRSSFVSLLRPIGETEVFAGSVALPSVGKESYPLTASHHGSVCSAYLDRLFDCHA